MTQPETAAPAVDPNRHRRAVIHVHEGLIRRLLGLPPDVEVRHCTPGFGGFTIDVFVTSPDLPPVDEACVSPTIRPTYETIDGRSVLVDTGISTVPGAAQWEWGYRYLDWAAGSAAGPMPERTARIRVAEDHSAVLLRRQPGETEWTEAPA
ncbi:MAG TPA: hypothetical protein VGL02_12370 [Streptomyces sp.]